MKFFKINRYKKIKLIFKGHSIFKNGVYKSKVLLDDLCKKYPKDALRYKKIFFSIYKDSASKEALIVAEDVLQEEMDAPFVKVVAARYRRIGNLERSEELLLSIGERGYVISDITRKSLLSVLEGCNEEEIEERVEELIIDFPNRESKIYELIFSIYKDSNSELAVKYGMRYFELNPFDLKFISILEKRVKELGLTKELDKIAENRKTFSYFKKLKQGTLFTNEKLDKNLLTEQLKTISKKMPDAYIDEYTRAVTQEFPLESDTIYEVAFAVLKNSHEVIALKYGETYLENNKDDSKFEKILKRRILKFNLGKNRNRYISNSEKEGFSNDVTKESISLLLEDANEEEIEERVEELIIDFPNRESKIYELIFSIYKDSNSELAVKYGMRYFELNPFDLKFISILEKRVKELGLTKELDKIAENRKTFSYFKKLKQGTLFTNEKLDKNLLTEQLKTISKKMPDAYIDEYTRAVTQEFPLESDTIYEVAFAVLKNSHEVIALKYGETYLKKNKKDSKFGRILKKRLFSFNFNNREDSKRNENQYISKLSKNRLFLSKNLDLKKFKSELLLLSNSFSEESVKTVVHFVFSRFPKQQDKISEIIFSVLKDTHIYLAIEYGKKHIELTPNNSKFARVLVNRMERVNLLEDMLVVSKEVLKYEDDSVLRHIVFKAEMQLEVAILEELYANQEFEKIEEKIVYFEKEYVKSKSLLYRLLHDFYSRKDYRKSEEYALKSLEIKENEFLRKNLYDLHIYYGSISRALAVIPENVEDNTLRVKKQNGSSLAYLLKNGFDLPIEDCSEEYTPIKNRVFYLLHNRLPYNSGGYATRSHGLLTNVASFGWEMNGVSRLGYPWDKMPKIESQEIDIIDDIKYHRLLKDKIGLGKLPMKDYLEEYAKELLKKIQEERPEIIHSASNHINGLVGNYVAKSVGIKSVYEVRGLWEITRISRQPEWKNTEYYELMANLEAEAAKGADVVLTLTEALKDEMISRGVDANKIEILPNGVTSNRFQPLSRDIELEQDLELKDKVVIGYIGSVVAYEGLEYLVDAVEVLINKGITNIAVLIVGDGAVLENIKSRVDIKELNSYFIFTGRVPHEEVEKYYSLVDITPFPRKGQPVCEMVSPLKPFEAMAMEKAVISSNVAALEEIVKDGYNGILFQKDSVEDLADKLEILINDKELRVKLGKQSREWVIEQRDWRVISKKLHRVYNELIN